MLKQLEITNFKSHRHTQLKFDDSRLQAIVGQNSAGKTSILQAINYLSQVSITHYQDVDRYISLQKYLANLGRENVTIGQRNLSLFVTGDNTIDQWEFLCELKENDDNHWKANRILKINGIEINEDKFYHLTQGIGKPLDYPQDLRVVLYLKLIGNNLSKAAYSQAIIPEIGFDGSGLAPTLDYLRNEAPDRFQNLQEMLRQIVPGVRNVGIRRAKVKIDRQRLIEVDGKSISYGETQEVTGQEIVLDMNTGDRIPAHAISEGTILTLGLLTVLMNPNQPNLVLLDDVEQGLHPKAQRELISVFKQILRANPNLQIIFTTHSPYLIDEIEPSQVHVLSNSKSGFTHAKRLDEHPDIEWAKQTLTTGEFWNAEGEDWAITGEVNV